MPKLLLVMIGGAIGAGLRYQVSEMTGRLGPTFPWGTLAVNLAGAFFMGILLAILVGSGNRNDVLRLFVGVGILGGFTTFSAFSAETASMLQRGDLAMAGAYVAGSVAGSLVLLFAGLWLVRAAAG